ncbi:MAG TPA: DUF4349 domain-containing protein [Humisphaera sp.]
MRTTLRSVIALAATALLSGCSVSGGYAEKSTFALDATEPVPGSIGTAAATPPPAAPPADAPAVKPDPAAASVPKPADASRLVIYSASFKVVVPDVPGALRAIQQSAERMGGHLQEVSGGTIIVRVPAARFPEAVKVVEDSGEVIDRLVKAQDVTEEMRDLNIRLDNAEKLRKRLQEILAKADKVEDALKVEAELARVSGELDAVKGKIRYLESLLAMSTIRVELNSPVRTNARGTGPRLPFDWVENLGDGLVAGEVQQATRKAGFFARGPRFKPPAGFVRYYEAANEVDAMDGGGMLLRVQRRANVDEAPADFWAKLARRQVVEGRTVAVTHEEGDATFYALRGTREVAGKPLGYVLVVKRSKGGVAVFEAWGPREQVDAQWPALRASGLSADAD